MIIRSAQSADATALLALDKALFPEAWSRKVWEDLITDPNHEVLIASTPSGDMGGFGVIQYLPAMADLLRIATSPACRGQGYGHALLRALINLARTAGHSRFGLEVAASNQSAIRFYERHGFVREGLRPGYYRLPNGGRDDALLMSLDLIAPNASGQSATPSHIP